jgi:raffinose/stachyose/melibiose transport system substrate-binding protein
MKPMNRRAFLGASAGAAGVLALYAAGCGGSGSNPSHPNVSMWTYVLPEELEQWDTDYVQPRFEKLSPGATFEIVNKGNNQAQILQTALAASSGPTVIFDDPTFIYSSQEAGYLAPLDGYAKKYDWSDKFLSWAYDLCKFDGKLYAVPERFESMIMLYSPPALSEKGWSVPKTHDDLVALCEEAEKAGMIPLAGGSADWHPATEWWLTIWWNSFTGPGLFYEALTGKAKFTDAGFVEAVESLKMFFEKGWIGGGAEQFFATQSATALVQVANGEAVFAPTGSWAFLESDSYFEGAPWDWAPMPPLSDAVDRPVFPLSVGAMCGLNAKADKSELDAGAAFLDIYQADAAVSANGLANVNRAFGCLKAPANILPSNTPKQLSSFYEQLSKESERGSFGFTTWTFLPPETDTYAYTAMEKVLLGQLEPADFCQNVQTRFEKERAAGNVVAAPKPTAFL